MKAAVLAESYTLFIILHRHLDSKEKCKRVFSQNYDFDKLRNISKILQGDNSVAVDMDPSVLLCFRFAPITSVDVERLFSQMKNVLSDRRLTMTPENLKKPFGCHVSSQSIRNILLYQRHSYCLLSNATKLLFNILQWLIKTVNCVIFVLKKVDNTSFYVAFFAYFSDL